MANCPELPSEAESDEIAALAASYDLRIGEAPKAKLESSSDNDYSDPDKNKKAASPPKPTVAPKPKVIPVGILPAKSSPPQQQSKPAHKETTVSGGKAEEYQSELPSQRMKRLREAREEFFKKTFENEVSLFAN